VSSKVCNAPPGNTLTESLLGPSCCRIWQEKLTLCFWSLAMVRCVGREGGKGAREHGDDEGVGRRGGRGGRGSTAIQISSAHFPGSSRSTPPESMPPVGPP
jgi:hypothetical protein